MDVFDPETEQQTTPMAARLHDAITALLLLVAFPFGFALLALSSVFGRSLPRAASAVVFLGLVHVAAIASLLFGETRHMAMLQGGPGTLTLLMNGVGAVLPALQSSLPL